MSLPAATRQRILQALFDNALDIILVADDQGRYVDVNPAACALLGYDREELLQKSVWDICPPEDRELTHERWREFIFEGQLIGKFTALCKDGTPCVLEFRSVAHALPGLHLTINRDVTERERAEAMLGEYYERVQALSRQLLTAQERERRHLARELHDEFGQVLATIRLRLHAARGAAGAAAVPLLEECGALLQQAGEKVRNLALDLRPTMLDVAGLEATLQWLVEHHRQHTGCAVYLSGHLAGPPLPPDLAIACFRVVQEALTNVVRHAGAKNVWIELAQSESTLQVVVRDDGVGFDVMPTQKRAVKNGSFGLLGMAERVHLLGGSLDIDSSPRHGTRITATFPLGAAPQIGRSG